MISFFFCFYLFCSILCTGSANSVGCASAWYADGRGFDHPARQHSFVKIGHEIISTAFSPSVVSYLVNRLGLSLPRKSVVRLTGRLDMTVAADWDVKYFMTVYGNTCEEVCYNSG